MVAFGTRPATADAYKLLHQGSRALARVEQAGLCIDRERLAESTDTTRDRIKGLESKMRTHEVYDRWQRRFGAETNWDSRDQLSWVLFSDMGYTHPTGERNNDGKGELKCDEAVLQTVPLKFCRAYLRHQKLSKLFGTYLTGIAKLCNGNRLHPSFELHRVLSYRGSSSDPNFQNIPIRDAEIGRIIRSIFVAPDDYYMLEADYGSIEVRVAACYHKDPTMLRYIETDYDMHSQMACKCLMFDHPKFDAYRTGADKVASKAAKGLRQLIKGGFVFAQFYGSWFKQCALEIWAAIEGLKTPSGIPIREHLANNGITEIGDQWPKGGRPRKGTFCHHIMEVEEWFWKTTFPRYDKWRKQRYKEYKAHGGFNTLTGFRCWGPMTRNQVINFPVQGSAFHCLLQSLIWLVNGLGRDGWRSHVVGQIHDSIVCYVHKDELDEFLPYIKYTMADRLRELWPWIITHLEVEAEVTPLAGCWFDKKEIAI